MVQLRHRAGAFFLAVGLLTAAVIGFWPREAQLPPAPGPVTRTTAQTPVSALPQARRLDNGLRVTMVPTPSRATALVVFLPLGESGAAAVAGRLLEDALVGSGDLTGRCAEGTAIERGSMGLLLGCAVRPETAAQELASFAAALGRTPTADAMTRAWADVSTNTYVAQADQRVVDRAIALGRARLLGNAGTTYEIIQPTNDDVLAAWQLARSPSRMALAIVGPADAAMDPVIASSFGGLAADEPPADGAKADSTSAPAPDAGRAAARAPAPPSVGLIATPAVQIGMLAIAYHAVPPDDPDFASFLLLLTRLGVWAQAGSNPGALHYAPRLDPDVFVLVMPIRSDESADDALRRVDLTLAEAAYVSVSGERQVTQEHAIELFAAAVPGRAIDNVRGLFHIGFGVVLPLAKSPDLVFTKLATLQNEALQRSSTRVLAAAQRAIVAIVPTKTHE